MPSEVSEPNADDAALDIVAPARPSKPKPAALRQSMSRREGATLGEMCVRISALSVDELGFVGNDQRLSILSPLPSHLFVITRVVRRQELQAD